MAVEKIEEYRQQNGVDILKVILKPTVKFPMGYFYAPAEAVDLVRQYTWYLSAQRKNEVYVIAHDNSTHPCGSIKFHIKLFEFYNNYKWQDDIDHRDMIEYDNAEQNLEPVTSQQNKFNKITRGYIYDTRRKPASFQSRIIIDGNQCYPFKTVRSEADACNVQNYVEQVWLKEELGSQYYMFDFLKYRRCSEDILDFERTGRVSEEEATYRHVMKYADNAWYYYRYGLEQYFKDNRIPIPKYSLDEYGFMRHPVTNQLLCPFH